MHMIAKTLSAPDSLTRGFVPGPRWGLRPQTPVIGSRYGARCVPFRLLDPPVKSVRSR